MSLVVITFIAKGDILPAGYSFCLQKKRKKPAGGTGSDPVPEARPWLGIRRGGGARPAALRLRPAPPGAPGAGALACRCLPRWHRGFRGLR